MFQIGIAVRLEHPTNAMLELFGRDIVDAVRWSAYFFAGAVCCCLIPNVVIWVAREFCIISVVAFNDDDDDP